MSVRECQRQIDAREFAEWLAFDSISPIGDERRDVMEGQVSFRIAQAFAAKGYRPKFIDFLPFAEKPKQTSADMLAAFDSVKARHNKREKRKRNGPRRKPRNRPDGPD